MKREREGGEREREREREKQTDRQTETEAEREKKKKCCLKGNTVLVWLHFSCAVIKEFHWDPANADEGS